MGRWNQTVARSVVAILLVLIELYGSSLLAPDSLSANLFSDEIDPQGALERAYENYQLGERSETFHERSLYFNQALQIYTEFETDYSSHKLLANIASCYFQLQEFPMAILYYRKALDLNIGDQKSAFDLAVARKEAGVNDLAQKTFFLNANQLNSLLFKLSLITFLFATLYIWWGNPLLRKGMIGGGGLCAILLCALLYAYYFEPIHAIVVDNSFLYQDAGSHYATVGDDPVIAGKEVEILQEIGVDDWIRVKTEDGIEGYIQFKLVRLIN
jgi:tetratricopeptide (TPR) repeat protein